MAMDNVSPEVRSRIMATVRGRDTRPELLVRSTLHRMGYRFRVHRRDLPGSPDIVLPRFRTCIFVHGCFWHRHPGCRHASFPNTRAEFWEAKFAANVARDARREEELQRLGWKPLIVWECRLRNRHTLEKHLQSMLDASGPGNTRTVQVSRLPP